MRDTAKKIFAIGALVVVLIGAWNLISRSSGRSALERYKAELRAKGEKLTFKEMAVTPSRNVNDIAALQVLNGYLSNYLSLSSSYYPHTMDYVAPGKARPAWHGQLKLDAGVQPVGEWQSLENDNRRASAALAIIRPALLVSPPDTGRIHNDSFSNLVAGPYRNFVRDHFIVQALQRDVIGELHKGNLDAALTDLHALAGQVRMNRNEPALVAQIIRAAIAGLALSTTWEALQMPGWDEVRLAGLQRDWEAADFMPGLEQSMEAERAVAQSIMAEVRHSGVDPIRNMFKGGPGIKPSSTTLREQIKVLWNEDMPWFVYRVTGAANDDELTQLQYSTKALELVRSLKSGRPWPEVMSGFSNMVADLDHKIGAGFPRRLLVSASALPNFSHAVENAVHNETQRRLTITAIAIKRFQMKHGGPPPSLDALTPEFLTKIPVDPMSGKPLCYRLNMDSGFVLYSVGEDGKDDGGIAGMDLWSGPDAVWPVVATPEEERAVGSSITAK